MQLRIVIQDGWFSAVCDLCPVKWVSVDKRRLMFNVDDHIRLHVNRDKTRPEIRIEDGIKYSESFVAKKIFSMTFVRSVQWKSNKPSVSWYVGCSCGWSNAAQDNLLQNTEKHFKQHINSEKCRMTFCVDDRLDDHVQYRLATDPI